MKRLIAVIAALILLSACAAETAAPSPVVNTSAPSASVPITPSAEPEKPNTATQPAAIRLDELPSPGIATNFSDENGVIQYTIVADSGTDGNTPTNNKFDGDGNLIYWTAYEFDDEGKRIKSTTKDADGNILGFEEFEYYPTGEKSALRQKYADGSLEFEYSYYTNGSTAEYTNYYNGKYVMKYDENGALIREETYDENETMVSEIEYDSDGNVTLEKYY